MDRAAKTKGLTRRGFLKSSAAHTGVAVLGSATGVAVLSRKARGAAWMLPDTSPESPNQHQMDTLSKIADTVIPNTDGPGAAEAGAAQVMADPFYGMNPYISEVVSDIDDATYWLFLDFDDFKNQSLSERTAIVEERLDESLYSDAYEGMILLAKLAFFGGVVNTVGYTYMGYPGPSSGYWPGDIIAPSCATRWWGDFWMTGLPLAVPDNNATGVSRGLAVNGTGTVAELYVSLNISHTWRGDLVVKLISPAGTVHYLSNREGGSADNIVLDHLRVYSFDGQPVVGTWKLQVADLAAADTGQVNSLCLHVTGQNGDPAGLACYWDDSNTAQANNCPSSWLGTGDGCDCGCQSYDPDCL
jgi:subtilisin-like proprotein convertase family protein